MLRRALFVILGLTTIIRGAVDIDSIPPEETLQAVPNSYIVQLSQGTLHARSTPHDEFFNHLKRRGVSYQVLQTYNDPQIFVGTAITVQDTAQLLNIVQADNVLAVYRNWIHDAPKPFNPTTPTSPNDPNITMDPLSNHKMTGIDKLHARGYKGRDIKIGLIDSGIDYNHPSLGPGFKRPNSKVVRGYDFVGDAFSGTNAPQPDDDPLDTCYGHGTAVAGILGANYNASYKFVGVAPEATLGAYRVFSCLGKSTDDIVVQALLRACKDRMDVINLALSAVTGWSSSVMSVVASNIAATGVVVVSTAGNNGGYGAWYAGSPSTGTNVISVGSVDSKLYTLRAAVASDGPVIPFIPSAVAPNTATPLPIRVPTDEFGCTIPTTPSLAGTAVIVRRGNCAFATKLVALRAAGAQYALVVNNVPGVEVVAMENFPSGLIRTVDGDYLIDRYKGFLNGTSAELRLSFPEGRYTTVQNEATAGLVSPMSSWGPSNDLFMKPNIMAPGGYVFTTFPTALGSWRIDSGTSFAAPLVAGAAALLLQEKSRFWQPIAALAAQDLFQSTAVTVRTTSDLTSPIQSLARQGTGLIQAYAALNTKTFINPTIMHLNDTAHARYTHKIWIQHTHFSLQKYIITHVPSATVLTINGIQPQTPPTLSTATATASISKTTITVLPYIPTSITVTFTPPAGLNPATFPVFSGQIKITNDEKQEQLVSSYMGVAGTMKDMKVIDNTSFYFGSVSLPLIYKGSGGVQVGPQNYTFQGTSYPLLYYRLTAGTAALRADLVTADTTLPAGVKTKRSLDSDALASGMEGNLSSSQGLKSARKLTRNSHKNRQQPHRQALSRSTDASGSHFLESRHNPTELYSGEELHTPEKRRFRNWLSWIAPQRPGRDDPTPPPPGTFDTFPIVGELRELWYQSRNSPDIPANNGYDAIAFQTPTFANTTRIPNGSYRILMRALRINGDPSENNDYEHWLSPIINVSVP